MLDLDEADQEAICAVIRDFLVGFNTSDLDVLRSLTSGFFNIDLCENSDDAVRAGIQRTLRKCKKYY